MLGYQLTDTSHQIITYKCIAKANSKEEAIKKAENWQEVSNDLDFNEIEAKEIVDWIMEENAPVRFQLQSHKYIWEPEKKGV